MLSTERYESMADAPGMCYK